MSIKTSLFYLVFAILVFGCIEDSNEPLSAQIIPVPLSQNLHLGSFTISKKTGLSFDENFAVAANFLQEYIASGSDITLGEGDDIVFVQDEFITNKEGYTLDISSEKIIIKAKTDQGAFYAVQSLRQLMPVELENKSFSGEAIAIQNITISDNPQFPYRGMHLDVARHMFSVDFIKKYIDALAMLKLNTFHWHLTDDQGWRIEIKKYPKLQEIAAFRNQTLIGHFSEDPQVFDGKKYGGYYTQEQIKEVVDYAKNRFITVIPEIEMPGHAQAAIAAYPELGCTKDSVKVAEKWGVFEDIFCAGEENTFIFLENVLDEVMPLFPSKYIHIGGDEAPKTHWKTCDACQKRIQDENLKDEHELQSYFIHRIEKYVNSKGKQIIGWDEILEGGLAPNATVMSWRGIEGAVEAAKAKQDVIMTPTSHAYFDYYQSTNPDEPIAIGGFLPLEKVYGFNPIPMGLNEEESHYILGVQGNLWTEYIQDSKQVEYMVFPRILALSEVVWSKPENKNYDDFIDRLEVFHKRLEILNINYANHLYEVEGDVKVELDKGNTFQLNTLTKGKTIRYTLDGKEPDSSSLRYENPLPISKSFTIKAALFSNGKRLGDIYSETLNYHKAVGAKISINVQPHHAYSGSGSLGLINGISGSDSRYGDKEWLGFWGEAVEIIIDLGVETDINSISTRFHNGNGQWIYAPENIELIFDDNVISKIDIPISDELLVHVDFEQKIKTRYVTLRIPNYGLIPEGKQGSGNPAWTFIDEIIVK
ncbi:beta-N-acetylhexosaminidase [Bizionia psychrotolerans]|uniref:beta-N-acetylhexosaminidase n=1 Tax=Bizionia psychrotolerans TaxID=1492901 RepID=UPI000650CFC4|nr:family 20 glycosylhydrolase [Bizionia psychrotolerans]